MTVPDKRAVQAEISKLQHRAEEAFIRGDVAPRLAAWSHNEPVSVFAALGPSRTGWSELEPMFRSVAARLADGHDVSYNIVAFDATDSMAWSAGFLTFTFSMDGGSALRRTLRITHVYRREPDGWKIAHEHSNWEAESDG